MRILAAGAFGGAALISLLGSIYAFCSLHLGFTAISILGFLSGMVGVTGLIVGCMMMVQETRLAAHGLSQEAQAGKHRTDSSVRQQATDS